MSVSRASRWPTKDPSDNLDFSVDWSPHLAVGEVITNVAWDLSDELTATDFSQVGATTVLWLTGGVPGKVYPIACKITTSDGREIERTVLLPVANL